MKLIYRIGSWFLFVGLLASCRSVPETEHRIDVNGQNLLYSVRGPEGGRPVVLMHGNGGSHKDLVAQSIQLAKAGYRVYSLDSRGQGANAPIDEYHYADMAEDCYCFIKALGLKSPVVAGWSDGGINALMMEMSHPGTAAAIVAAGANITPDCGGSFEEFKQWIYEHDSPLTRMMLTEPQIDPAELSAIKCPALVIAGDRDVISVEHTTLIADSIPNAELAIVKNADHSSYIVKDTRLGRYMLDFLKRNNIK